MKHLGVKECNGVERKASNKCLVPTVCKTKFWVLQVQVSHGGGVSSGQVGPGPPDSECSASTEWHRVGDDGQEERQQGDDGVGGWQPASMRLWVELGPQFPLCACHQSVQINEGLQL